MLSIKCCILNSAFDRAALCFCTCRLGLGTAACAGLFACKMNDEQSFSISHVHTEHICMDSACSRCELVSIDQTAKCTRFQSSSARCDMDCIPVRLQVPSQLEIPSAHLAQGLKRQGLRLTEPSKVANEQGYDLRKSISL